MTERLVTVGEVRGVYGVKGWVKLFSYTTPRDNLLSFGQFQTDGDGPLRLLEGRPQGKGLVGRFEGCDDRDAALAMHGTVLKVARTELPEPDVGEYYWDDLIGLAVIDEQVGRLGSVRYLIETGADDVMVIRDETGPEILVPFAWEQVVLDVNLAEGEIRVDWPGASGEAGDGEADDD